MSSRIPYKAVHTRGLMGGILQYVPLSDDDAHNDREIEIQVAKGIIKFLEKEEHRDLKARVLESEREEIRCRASYGVRDERHLNASMAATSARIAVREAMQPEAWMHPDDHPILFYVALARAICFYIEGSFDEKPRGR